MRKHLRGNSGMRFLAILTAVALTLGSVDVTALASAAGQNAAEQTAVEPKNTEGQAAVSGETEGQGEPKNDGEQPGGNGNAVPGSGPKQNTDAPEDNETPADPEGTGETSGEQKDELETREADIAIYGSTQAESGKLAYLDPTVLRPAGDGRWSNDNGNLLWFGKETDGTPMQYRILSSTNVFSTDAKNGGLLLNSVKKYKTENSENWWGTDFYNTAALTSQESGAIARAKDMSGTSYTTFVFNANRSYYWNALTALYTDGTDMTGINGASMYLDPSRILMVSKTGSMKYNSDSELHSITNEQYKDADWKLTLLDADKSVTDAALSYTGTRTDTGAGQYQITCTYQGATDDKLSIMVTDKDYNAEGAQILCYGYVNPDNKNNRKTDNGSGSYTIEGTFSIAENTGVTAENLKSSYHMYLIVEHTSGQYNDNLYGTDYASEPYEVQVGEAETHYMCGYTGTSWDEHRKLHPACGWTYSTYTFKPWNRTDSLPTEAGYYYLVNDVELTETWNVPTGWTYLCLSGKSITMNGNGAAISVSTNGKLHLTDCKEENNHITHAEGYEGSGIAISGNSNKVDDKGKVYLYNIKITGNKAEKGGGIYCENADSGSFQVSRDTVIDGNTALDGTTPNNVYLCKDQRIYVQDPGEKMRIGVTTDVTPTEEKSVTITKFGNIADANYVFSDQEYDMGTVQDTQYSDRYNLTLILRTAAITATEADGTAASRSLGLGTSILRNPAIPTETDAWSGSYVWFGYSFDYNNSNNPGKPVKYRVLSKDTTELGKNGEHTLFLDSEGLKVDARTYTGKSNSVITYMSSFYNYSKAAENNALVVSKITEQGKEDSPFFILTPEQAKSGRYGYSNSGTGASIRKGMIGSETQINWWLHGGEAYVTADGAIAQGNNVAAGGGMTTNVDLSKILLSEVTSNADDGATGAAGKLGTAYKLTLLAGKDEKSGTENIKIVPDTNIQRTEDEVTLTYDLSHYAKEGYSISTTYYRINQVSVLFLDKEYTEGNTNGAKLLGCVKVDEQKEFKDYKWSNFYDKGLNGSYTKKFTVPEGLRDKQCGRDYHAYLIAEQVNGEHESNFASAPVEITIPKGSYQIVHTVVKPQGEEVTYDAQNPIDVTGFFTLDSRLAPYMDQVTVTYELLTGEGVTGVGTLDENQKLTVTKCGTFKIKVTTSAVNDAAGDPLYSEGEAVATLTVKKAAGSMGDVTVANTDSAKTDIIYGDTWSVSTDSDTNSTVSYTYWLSSQSEEQATATRPTDVGTYTVKATYAATDLYEACSKTAEFTILPRPAALQWSETKLTYKGDAQSVTATVTNKVSPDTDDSFNLEYTGNTEIEAGNYTAGVTALGNPNYTLDGAANTSQSWSIAYLTAPASPLSVTGTKGQNDWYVSEVTLRAADGYQISADGGATWQGGFGYTTSGTYHEGQTYRLRQTDTGYITAPAALPVIKVDLTAPTGKLQINTREIEQTDSVLWKWFFREKAEITVTAADEVSGVAKIEYQSVNAPGGYQENGYWKKLDDSNRLTIPVNASQILYFKITDSAGNESILNSNGVVVYTDATATGEVNFVKTTTADQDTGIRVAENTVASIKEGTEEAAAGAYQIKEVNGEKHLILTAAYLKSLTDGTHTLTAAYDANGHAWDDGAEGEKPADSTITVVVSRAQGVVTILGEQSKVYDGRPVSRPSITTENDRGTNNANVTIEYKVKGADDSTYTKEAPKDYGTYVVRVTVAQDDSHTEAVVTKEFSITKKRMTLTAEDYSGTYDGQKHAITVTVTDPADVEISYRASENASWQSTPVTYRDAGTYTVYYQVTSENYETETGSRTITITPKTVALTWGTTTFTYDGTEKIPTVTVDSSSLYSGDSCQVTGMKGAQKAAGTYSAEAAALDNANYQLPDGKTVAFTIEKAAVTIQADDAGKHIEKADPKLTYRITEGTLAEGDSLKGITVSREKGETAGAYKIMAGLAAGAESENPNYEITVSDKAGVFTIGDHDQAKVSAVAAAPTCTKNGSTEERSCSVCEKVMTASVEIPALGHDWTGEWKVVKEATATENGRQEKTCGREGCGQKMYEVIPATGQSPDEDGTGQGDLSVDLEITQDAPIASGGIYNTKKELLDAPGIFSEAEKTAIAEGKEAKVWVEITKTDLAEEEKAAFEQEAKKTAGENAKLVYFSAELFRQIGENVERISEPGAKIRLTIRIPDELVNTDSTISREYFILRMHDGELTVLNGSFDKDTREYTFETDKFSDYAIVCKDTKIETKPDDKKTGSSGGSSKAPVTSAATGDRNQPLAWMLLAVAATGIIAVAIRRKKRQ